MKKLIHNVETGETLEIELTVEEIAERESAAIIGAWSSMRSQRDALLSSSDWTVLSDTPASTAAWKAYRQQLRDLPANTVDPFNVEWPTPPA